MKTIVVAVDGKQLLLAEGTVFKVNSTPSLDSYQVLFFNDGENELIGKPYLPEISVKFEKLEDRLDEKVSVARFRAKSRYRKNKGFRQPISIFKVVSIDKKENK